MQFLQNTLAGAEGEAIRRFLIWFLKARYFRHLKKDGRMTHKMEYVNFKNLFVLQKLTRMKVRPGP